MTGTYDGTTLSLYVDGQIAASGPASGTVDAGADPFLIGVTPVDYANGLIDDVRIYNRALSATEVKQLYNLGTVIIKPN